MKTIGYILVLCLIGPYLLSGQFSASETLTSKNSLQRVNSDFDELSPILSADGLKLFFVRRNHPQNMGLDNLGDVWLAQRAHTNVAWGPAVNLGGPINSIREDKPVGLDALGNTVYMAKQSIIPISKDGRLWQERYLEPIDLDVSSIVWISPLGDLALSSRNDLAGFGGYDLYLQLRLPSGNWSDYINLGPSVNTSADEKDGFLAPDEQTLYFSSNGPNGIGATDWWHSKRTTGDWENWERAQNLGPTVNTAFDDIHLSCSADASVSISARLASNQFELKEVFIPEHLRPGASQLVQGRVQGLSYGGNFLTYTCTSDRMLHGDLWLPASGDYAIILPVNTIIHLEAKVNGFLGQSTLITDEAPETLLDQPDNTLASLAEETSYIERDASISSLRLQLDQLNQEKIALQEERDNYLRNLRSEAQQNSFSPRTDPEIEALRHRYDNYLQTVQGDTLPPNQTQARAVPQSYDYAGSQSELDEMKARFRQHFEAERREKGQTATSEEYLWSEPNDFDQVQQSIEKELRAEMTPAIGQRVLSDWEAGRTSAQQIETEAIKQEIAQSFWVPKRPVESKEYLPEDLRKELKEKMRPAIALELEQSLRQDIEQAARTTAELRSRETEIKQLEQQIDDEVLQQIQTEELSNAPSYEATNEQSWMAKSPKLSTQPPGLVSTQRDLRLIPKQSGSKLILAGILFAPNSDYFKPASMPELKRLVEFLSNNPELSVEIGGHTNALLSHAFALQLSKDRADAVVDYLIQNGIASQRLVAKAYGKTKPITDNNTPEGRQKNQRIELMIL